jgi:acetyltransferase-like isoleucine patch superfamily enzyme
MVHRPYRDIAPTDAAHEAYDAWLEELEARLEDPDVDRNELVRETLRDIYYPQIDPDVDESRLPAATRAALAHLDPRGITLEPEYYHELDRERYEPRKPVIWLWQMFDRSPLGGNVHLGVKLRRLLAPHVFASVGDNFKCFHFVEVSFGYNLHVGDDVVVHRNVLLDDRGGIEIGDNVSISDYASVFSHTHSIEDIGDVTTARTVLGDGARITYGAVVLAGVHVGEEGMVGARAVATRDVRPYHVNVGIPAKSVAVKEKAPPEHRTRTTLDRAKGEGEGKAEGGG